MFVKSKPNTVDQAHKQLGYAVVLQAIKDYFDPKFKKKKIKIIQELCSDWMIFISDGLSEIAAQKLLSDPKAIENRINNLSET